MNDAFKQHGAFSWSELLVDNVESAIVFYTAKSRPNRANRYTAPGRSRHTLKAAR